MKTSRRKFIGSGAALAVSMSIPAYGIPDTKKSKASVKSTMHFDPWIEVIPEAIRNNARVLHKLSGNKPVMAVIKNNGYGLGDINIAKILDDVPEVVGFAAVKTDACIAISESGIAKPLLHLGMTSEQDFLELARHDIRLSIFDESVGKRLEAFSDKLERPINTHIYLDTGMSRMGIPYHRAMPWIEDISSRKGIQVIGTFMGFTEVPSYDQEQLSRLTSLDSNARKKGINLGILHAASSNAIYHFPESSLDMVRPGMALYGAYPTYPDKEKQIAALMPGYRLRARVVRVEKLRTGDSVSYDRNYIAEKPVWVATIPIGHADGYPRGAVRGARILIGDKTYPVIGAVSASHTIVELGDEETVNVGDIATLTGPDHADIHPNYLSQQAKMSIYDILMHLSARLPKVIL